MSNGTLTVSLEHYQELLDFKKNVMQEHVPSSQHGLFIKFYTKENAIKTLENKLYLSTSMVDSLENKCDHLEQLSSSYHARIFDLENRSFFKRLFNKF